LFFSISSIQTHVYPTNNAVTTETSIIFIIYSLVLFVTVVFNLAFSRHRAAAAATAQRSTQERMGWAERPQRGILSLCFAWTDGWVGRRDGVWIGLDWIGPDRCPSL
jgi:hypothetical protein